MNAQSCLIFSVLRWRAVVLCVGGYLLLSTYALPQGSLTPSGAPAPTRWWQRPHQLHRQRDRGSEVRSPFWFHNSSPASSGPAPLQTE